MIDLRLSSFTYGPIVTSPVVPAELSSLAIPGSEMAFAEGNYGQILFQEIHAGEVIVLYNIYQVKEDLALDFRCGTGSLRAHMAVKNDSHYFINGIGDFFLSEGQFNIIEAPRIEGTYYLEADQEYRTLHVIFSQGMLDKLLPVFSYLEEWLACDSSTARFLFNIHSWQSPQLKDVIDKLLFCTYSNELLEFYRELKVKELLCLALMRSNGEIAHPVRLTRRDTELIYAAKGLLDKGFGRHVTVASVARQMGLNEFRLKSGFKQVFGITLFDYLIKKRMQEARSLLLETDKPIKEIAYLTGYSTKQSFLNAFKRYFHDTPGSFRRN